MRITIVGGGNIGTFLAGLFTRKGNEVTIYTRDKSKWNNTITVVDQDKDEEYTETIFKITESMKEALIEAELVIVTVPAMALDDIVNKMYRYIKAKTIVGFMPGTGGCELIGRKLLKKDAILFGTQRVLSVVRLIEYGKKVKTTGKRDEMYISVIPSTYKEKVKSIFADLFDVKTNLLPNYLNVTLTPSNPILHTVRLYSLFKDYHPGSLLDKIPLFYEDWDIETSEMIMACDNELHKIFSKLKKMDMSGIKYLVTHYDSVDALGMTNKIRSIEGFKGIKTPQIELDGKYMPDFNSRYFKADFPYGLMIIKGFALITKVKTPMIDKVIRWYQNIENKKYIDENGNLDLDSSQLRIPQNYGINTISEIYNYYDL